MFIWSQINIYYLTGDSSDIDLNFKIKDFKLPLEINNDIVDILLKIKKTDGSPTFMYMWCFMCLPLLFCRRENEGK